MDTIAKHRTWLLEALRLHFDEKLPRIEAGRRLGIPKPRPAISLFASGRPVSPGLAATNQRQNSWISAFTNRHPGKSSVLPASSLLPVKSLSPATTTTPPTATKIAMAEQSMQPGVSAWRLPAKITLTIIFCSTGGDFISRGCWLRGQMRRSCCP